MNSAPTRDRLTWAQVGGALQTQVRVLNALILRDTKSRYGEHKLGFLWALIEPTLMIAVFVFFFAIMGGDDPGGMPIVPFMIVGFVPFTMFRETMGQLQNSIVSNRTLIGFPQVTTFDVIIARALLETAVLLCVFVVLLFMAQLVFGSEIRVQRPLEVLACCLLLATIGTGLGFVFASISPVIPSLKQVGTLALGRPLFLGSGLFFTADSLPSAVRDILLWNPLLHAIELARSAFFREFESEYGSWSYVCTWALCTFAVGLLVHQAMRKRAIVGL